MRRIHLSNIFQILSRILCIYFEQKSFQVQCWKNRVIGLDDRAQLLQNTEIYQLIYFHLIACKEHIFEEWIVYEIVIDPKTYFDNIYQNRWTFFFSQQLFFLQVNFCNERQTSYEHADIRTCFKIHFCELRVHTQNDSFPTQTQNQFLCDKHTAFIVYYICKVHSIIFQDLNLKLQINQ